MENSRSSLKALWRSLENQWTAYPAGYRLGVFVAGNKHGTRPVRLMAAALDDLFYHFARWEGSQGVYLQGNFSKHEIAKKAFDAGYNDGTQNMVRVFVQSNPYPLNPSRYCEHHEWLPWEHLPPTKWDDLTRPSGGSTRECRHCCMREIRPNNNAAFRLEGDG